MEKRDREVLHRMVQHYRMPAVLRVLAEIALRTSLPLRDLRDDEETVSGARIYRKQANCWEHLSRVLRWQARKVERVGGGDNGNRK